MSHNVRIKAGLFNVQLPDGKSYDGGKLVTLTDDQFAQLAPTALGDEVLDEGANVPVPGSTKLYQVSINQNLNTIANGKIAEINPGFAGTVVDLLAIVTTAATTAAKTATINLDINGVNTTGGVLTITSATATPVGNVIDATAFTAANAFSASQVINIEAASVTAFVEGAVTFYVLLKAN